MRALGSVSRFTLAALAALAVLAACGRTISYPDPPPHCVFDVDCPAPLRCVDAECREWLEPDASAPPHSKRFGEACAAPDECLSGLCIGGPTGAFCSASCPCPTGFECKSVPDAGAACARAEQRLCQSCERDEECGASGADLCLDAGCAQDCTFTACPAGYACSGGQCRPAGGSCGCTPETFGLAVACRSISQAGTCVGARVCQSDGGFDACSAPVPVGESCNGLDDDCDGVVDDLRRACAEGACIGELRCTDAGARCDAPAPAPERCDYSDNDCNGVTDDGFTDDAGRYLTPASCGGCGNDCTKVVPHAVSTTCALAAGAPACRATACATGFFVMSGACVPASDSLCLPCARDGDCAGQNSACLALGTEHVCGRDCSARACPAGYTCQSWDGGLQCAPSAGTCDCTSATLGAVRSCAVSTCRGYQRCAASAGSARWSACDVASFNTEICDAVDNNCDGRVDEGFRDGLTGKYTSPQSCGFCNNDCSRYWSPQLQHAVGACDTAPAVPVCRMGACLAEVDAGVTYEWVDVNVNSADGCECRRRFGNTTVDDPDRSGSSGYADENCDGVDGVIGDALFVSTNGTALGDGTRSNPFPTLSVALGALGPSGKRYVLVAAGTYAENVVLFAGAQLFGGYSPDFLQRNPLLYETVIAGQKPVASASGPIAAVHGEHLHAGGRETVVAGFTVRGYDRPAIGVPDVDGEPSIAVFLRDADSSVVLSDDVISAGHGGGGGRGSAGGSGFGAQASPALAGAGGLTNTSAAGSCPVGATRAGGAGGTSSVCAGAAGGAGGTSICPVVDFVMPGLRVGHEQQYRPDAGLPLAGLGGFDWFFDDMAGAGCNIVDTLHNPHDGLDGFVGPDGLPGAGGAGAPAAARFGSVASGRWVLSPSVASPGTLGAFGAGGGGGGAGGGVGRNFSSLCFLWELGASGGGGGAGGCGGSGGLAGRGGGASFAVLLVQAAVRLVGSSLSRSFGGEGGNGGFGGPGGLGGAGGRGGRATTWSGSIGGQGGNGGRGGPGGGGGGGAGGPSFALLSLDVDVAPYLAQNHFVAAGNTGGAGGQGGSAAGAGATGQPGASGAFGDALTLRSCAMGCTGGATCDANGLCIPP